MDILDILLDILFKPPQPFIGLFLTVLIDSYDRNRTQTQTQTRRLNHLQKTGTRNLWLFPETRNKNHC